MFFFLLPEESIKLTPAQLRACDKDYTLEAVECILAILRKYGKRLTFFLVFRLEEVYPGLIEKLLDAGHEVGWHTHNHVLLHDHKTLLSELEQSAELIKRYDVKSFRASSVYFFREGYSLLSRYGLKYSSSIYGDSSQVHELDGILEVPVSTNMVESARSADTLDFPLHMTMKNIFRHGLPCGSGFFWSLLSKHYYDRLIRRFNSQDAAFNTFVHDWQIVTPDLDCYRRTMSVFRNPSYYPYSFNVRKTLEYLLDRHQFQRFDEYGAALTGHLSS